MIFLPPYRTSHIYYIFLLLQLSVNLWLPHNSYKSLNNRRIRAIQFLSCQTLVWPITARPENAKCSLEVSFYSVGAETAGLTRKSSESELHQPREQISSVGDLSELRVLHVPARILGVRRSKWWHSRAGPGLTMV